MGFKRYLPLFVVVALIVVVNVTATTREDPELKTCQHQCRQTKHYGEEQRRQCERQCEEYSKEKHRRERQGKGGEREGSLDENPRWLDPEFDPQQQPRRETEGCGCRRGRGQREFEEEEEEAGEWGMGRRTTGRQQGRRQEGWRREGRQQEEEFGEGRRHQGREGWRREGRQEEEEFGERGGEGHPFVFKDEHFETKYRTQLGRERTLPKFSEVSRLLSGIENFRVSIFEARPMTFMLPKHCDADAVLFVAKGRGAITLVHPDNKESFNIEKGHIMRLRAGTSVYLVNSDEEERLVLVKLIKPVSHTGRFETFYGAGGQNPESFFSAFSDEILEASFNASSDELDRIFTQQDEGVVVKASREQIRSLTQQQRRGEEEGSAGSRGWPFGGGGSRKGSRGPLNLFRQKPSFRNEFGSLFEVNSDDFQQLQDLDIDVTFANITQGGMTAPHFNTRATKIAVVVKGEGRFEMACPHVGQQQRRQQQGGRRHGSGRRGGQQGQTPVRYQKISGNLNVGTVFIVPTGHPFVTVASQDENLQIICFEVNSENNRKIQLAGQRSIIKQFEREAKELAFGESAEFIDEILERQDEEFFFPGPEQQRHQGRPRRFRPTRQPREEEGRADQ